jgi:hypothetical protein
VSSPEVFGRLWTQALDRLKLDSARPAAMHALRAAWRIALAGGPAEDAAYDEAALLALSAGGVAVFPGRAPVAMPRKVIAGSTPVPGCVLVIFADRWEPPAPELLDLCAEVVLVRRADGQPALQAALAETVRKWRPQSPPVITSSAAAES